MPFPSLIVRQAPPAAAGLTARADVAVFVGLTHRRASPLPASLRAWLEQAGWAGTGAYARSELHVQALLDVPVPVESWSDFDALFAWENREAEAGSPQRIPCPLGLAVKSFFGEGGAKAYVVRTGDPRPLLDRAAEADVIAAKRRLVSWAPAAPPDGAADRVALLPGFGDLGAPADAGDPNTWRGAAHVWGLDDAALLALPDLPDLFSGNPGPVPNPPEPPPAEEQFKACAPVLPTVEPDPRRNRLNVSAPRMDREAYGRWADAIAAALRMLASPRGPGHRRDVMLVASLPLPSYAPEATPARSEAWPLALLDETRLRPASDPADPPIPFTLFDTGLLGSARLQLAYPWVETPGSTILPEGVEGAEGVLLGAIARTALAAGAFRSAAGAPLPSVLRNLPELGTGDLRRGVPGKADWLGDRLTLAGFKAGQPVLLSDSTTSSDVKWRAGGVSRLMNVILRAARRLGTELFFESSGPALWAQAQQQLEGFMTRLWDAGALAGATRREAFEVRCDRTTMSQPDIDAGRVICTVAFQAAQPIQRILVTLALTEAPDAIAREAA